MDESNSFQPSAVRLMDQVRVTLRFYHYAYSTEKSYVDWILKFIRFNDKQHPKDMGKPEIERFLCGQERLRACEATIHAFDFKIVFGLPLAV